MTLVRKHPMALGILASLAIGAAALVVYVGRPRVARTNAPGVSGDSSVRFHAHEITPGQSESMGVNDASPILESRTTEKGKVHYFADGCSLSSPGSPNRQANWVCMFNPAGRSANLKFTFYYEDSDPTYLELAVPAETSLSINLFDRKEVLHNQRFGAKIESSDSIVVQVSTGYYGADDKADWYTRAMHSVICNTMISRVNYYADGLVIDRKGSRLKEPEWAFLLNPNHEPAKVLFYAYYTDGEKKIYTLDIPPRRLFPLLMDSVVLKNKLFGAKFVSNVPLAIQQTRWVEEEDRQTIRSAFSVMALPGELAARDAD